MSFADTYLTRKQVCETLGVSNSTLRRLVDFDDFPQPIQVSERRQLFRDNDVFDWLQERDLDRMRAIHDGDTYDEYWDEGEDGDEEVQRKICRYKIQNYSNIKKELLNTRDKILIHPALRVPIEKVKNRKWEGRLVEENGKRKIIGGNLFY